MFARTMIAVLLLGISSVASSGEAASRESVEKLMELTGTSKMVDAMHGQIGRMFEGMGEEMGVTEADRPAFDRYMQKVAALMREEVSWEKMKEPTIDIYVRNFTQAEIEGLIEFYSSEVGQSMVNKMPIVMQEAMSISQNTLKDTMPKIKALAIEMRAEITASREKRDQE